MSISSANTAAMLAINIDGTPTVKASGTIEYQNVEHMMHVNGLMSIKSASSTRWYSGALCINTIRDAIPIVNSNIIVYVSFF